MRNILTTSMLFLTTVCALNAAPVFTLNPAGGAGVSP
jgi:hypothetical protein